MDYVDSLSSADTGTIKDEMMKLNQEQEKKCAKHGFNNFNKEKQQHKQRSNSRIPEYSNKS